MTEFGIDRGLRIVAQMLEPESLSKLQELILKECWSGKTYQEIALASGYDSDYIRVVGSRLWQSLSVACEAKITKNNFKSVLRKKAQETELATFTIEVPDGRVPPNSSFYIERSPTEIIAYQEIMSPGALISIKSPSNMGKTSLMIRILTEARSQNYHVVSLNLQLAESSMLGDLEKLLRWLIANIALQLEIESEIKPAWNRDLGIKISCTKYFQQILESLGKPLVLALDEVDRLFCFSEIAQEFWTLLKFWHEEASNSKIWKNLRLIIVCSTNADTPLNIYQSPFDIGLPLTLPKFNLAQVQELACRYQLQQKLVLSSLESLTDMVGGHPYLTRLAFHALSTQEITLERLIEEAPTPSGIYGDYLRGYFKTILNLPELFDAFAQIVADPQSKVSDITAYKLEWLGAVEFLGDRIVPSCQLYALYFRNYLAV